jgi:predicted nucleic acid-binding protein
LNPPGSSSPVVSNTTPLITLAGVGMLDLLPALYQEIWVPDQVEAEYQNGIRPGEPALRNLSWLRILPVQADADVAAMLDAGEAAALTLARQCNARLVLMDEMAGRRVATTLGFRIAGTLGILLEAKQHALLTAVAPIIDQMVAQGRRISPTLRRQVLDQAGE